MINIGDTIAHWPRDPAGWAISPGVEWCKAGNRILVWERCYLDPRGSVVGDYFMALDDFVAGSNFRVGKEFRVGNRFRTENGFRAGDYFWAEDDFTPMDGVCHGDYFRAGNNATGIANLGRADGFTKSLSSVNGVAYIGSECRWLTLTEALMHWGNHKKERSDTMLLLESAKKIATLHALKFHNTPREGTP